MAEMISSFCRVYHLIFVETGCDHGEEVYWFKRFDGERVCLDAQEIRSRLQKRAL